MDRTDLPDPRELARSLRRLLAAVDAGEVSVPGDHRAYLMGAAGALEAIGSDRAAVCPLCREPRLIDEAGVFRYHQNSAGFHWSMPCSTTDLTVERAERIYGPEDDD